MQSNVFINIWRFISCSIIFTVTNAIKIHIRFILESFTKVNLDHFLEVDFGKLFYERLFLKNFNLLNSF